MTELRPLAPGRLLVGGCPEGYDARHLAETIARARGPVIHVVRDDARLAATRASLRFFAPELPVLSFPAWDCLPYDRISPNPEIAAARMATLAALAAGFTRPAAILTTSTPPPSACPPATSLAAASMTAAVGQRIDVAALRAYLARMGFQQAPTVTEPGEFAIRGGLIDLFPPGARAPVRLDLFGDVLESARRFDPETQRTSETVKRVELAPVSEVILDAASIERFRTRYRAHVRRRRPRRPALRGDQRRPQAPGLRALAAVLPRAAGDALRLPPRRAGPPRRPDRRRPRRPLGRARRAVRRPRLGAGGEIEARHRLQAGPAGRALPRRRRLGGGGGRAARCTSSPPCRSRSAPASSTPAAASDATSPPSASRSPSASSARWRRTSPPAAARATW